MAGQPRLEFSLGLYLFLQGAQGLQARGQVGLARRFLVGCLLLRTPLLVQMRHLVLQLLQTGLGHGVMLRGRVGIALHLLQTTQVRTCQPLTLARQLLAPELQLTGLLLDAAALGGQHLDLLLHLARRGALGVGHVLGCAHRIFEHRQPVGLLLCLGLQQLALLLRGLNFRGHAFEFGLGFILSLSPLRLLGTQVGHALLHALAAFHHVADALLQPADLQRSVGQRTLGQVQPVRGGVVRLTHCLQLGLHMPQLGHTRLQRGGCIRRRLAHTGLLTRGVSLLQKPQLVQLQCPLVLEAAIGLRHLGLLFQLVQVGVQLAQDVVHTRQVLPRVLQPVLGLAPALLVLGDARSLLKKQAQLLRAGFDDAADGALADDGVSPRAQAGAQEHVLHIATADGLAVDVVAAGAVTGEHTAHGDLAEAVPLPAGPRIGVVEHQLHAGAVGRLALARAVEDDVLHGLPSQLAGLAFAQHPAYGVHDVGLATAVRPHHAHQLPRQLKRGGFRKGLEARELDLVQTHGSSASRPRTNPARSTSKLLI